MMLLLLSVMARPSRSDEVITQCNLDSVTACVVTQPHMPVLADLVPLLEYHGRA